MILAVTVIAQQICSVLLFFVSAYLAFYHIQNESVHFFSVFQCAFQFTRSGGISVQTLEGIDVLLVGVGYVYLRAFTSTHLGERSCAIFSVF